MYVFACVVQASLACVCVGAPSFFCGARQSTHRVAVVVYRLIFISWLVYGPRDGILKTGSPSLPNLNPGNCEQTIYGVHNRWGLNVETQ